MTNYSVLKSKTFWTLVVTFVVTAGNAIVPLLPAGAQVTIVAILLALATIFHVSGVNNAAVASANAKLPVSGQ
jgi:hypothetical protein